MKTIDLILALLLAGIVVCGMLVYREAAAAPPYWVHSTTHPTPRVVTQIINSPAPCGRYDFAGCALPVGEKEAWIVLRTDLHGAMRACVEAHERRHMEKAEDHDLTRPVYAFDCGDGTMFPPPITAGAFQQ